MNEMNTKIYNYEITVLNAKNEPKVYKTTRNTLQKQIQQRIKKLNKE